jgi:hypothetical protein
MTAAVMLRVEVSVPRACYDTLGNYHAIQAFLREVGVLAPQAQDVRWRQDVVNAGYIVSYSVPVPTVSRTQQEGAA